MGAVWTWLCLGGTGGRGRCREELGWRLSGREHGDERLQNVPACLTREAKWAVRLPVTGWVGRPRGRCGRAAAQGGADG